MAVGWYLRFSLSHRDVEELLVERGLDTDHVTVWRWVQRYALELERRFRCELCGGHPVRVEVDADQPDQSFRIATRGRIDTTLLGSRLASEEFQQNRFKNISLMLAV
jgi:hypothetical protein